MIRLYSSMPAVSRPSTLLFIRCFRSCFPLRTQGLCGSYTTYSGWNLRIARAALGQIPGAPSGAIVTIVAIATSLAFFSACFVAGSDLMKQIASRGRRLRLGMLGGGGSEAVRAALGMLGSVYVLLAILLAVDENWSRRIDWVACMFAPFGALLRFFLSRCESIDTLPQPRRYTVGRVRPFFLRGSRQPRRPLKRTSPTPPPSSILSQCMCRQLNNRWREGAFPLGTFAANVLGSLVMALVFYGTKNSSSLTTGWSNVVIKAFQVGFGGLLCYPVPTVE